MAGFKRTLTVGYGMTQAVCDLTSTKASGAGVELTQLCSSGHDPAKPAWDPVCPTCGPVARDSLVKGHEVAKGQYVVFSRDEIAALRDEDASAYKGQLLLTAHDAREVGNQVMPSGTTYMLTPSADKKKAPGDQRPFYAMLRTAIDELAGEVAFLGRYTVTSKASLYRVRVFNGVLIAEQQLATDEVVEVPVLDLPPVPEQMLDPIRQTARMFIVPFDPATYANSYAAKVAAAVAERDSVDATGAMPSASVTPIAPADPFAAMQAQMQAMLAAQGNGSPAEAVADKDGKPKAKGKKAKAESAVDAA